MKRTVTVHDPDKLQASPIFQFSDNELIDYLKGATLVDGSIHGSKARVKGKDYFTFHVIIYERGREKYLSAQAFSKDDLMNLIKKVEDEFYPEA